MSDDVYAGNRVRCYTATFLWMDVPVRYSVRFGDTGYESDPGVEMETLPVTITEVKEAIGELRALLAVLEGLPS